MTHKVISDLRCPVGGIKSGRASQRRLLCPSTRPNEGEVGLLTVLRLHPACRLSLPSFRGQSNEDPDCWGQCADSIKEGCKALLQVGNHCIIASSPSSFWKEAGSPIDFAGQRRSQKTNHITWAGILPVQTGSIDPVVMILHSSENRQIVLLAGPLPSPLSPPSQSLSHMCNIAGCVLPCSDDQLCQDPPRCPTASPRSGMPGGEELHPLPPSAPFFTFQGRRKGGGRGGGMEKEGGKEERRRRKDEGQGMEEKKDGKGEREEEEEEEEEEKKKKKKPHPPTMPTELVAKKFESHPCPGCCNHHKYKPAETYEERLQDLGLASGKKRRMTGDMIAGFQVFVGLPQKGEGVNLFSTAPEGRTKNNGWKLTKERSNLELRRNFLTCFHQWRFLRRDWAVTCLKWYEFSCLSRGLD
ncbi:Ubiquitin carboxyl-terminal hydrolase 35, partial [Ophiophagus hannah]